MTDAERIAEIIQGIYRDFKAGRPHAIEAVQHPDCTLWDVFTPNLIRGLDERKKFHAHDQSQMKARGALALDVEAPVVDVWGEVAVALYYVNFRYQPPNPAEGRVRITSIFRKQLGQWLMVHHHESLAPSGPPPISEKADI